MRRRKFIQLTSSASVLSLVPSEVFSLLKTIGGPSCPNLGGKKLILIQLAGANDGLNTVVPLNQYDLYANLRPTLKLSNSGSNGIINLDSTLSIEDQVGLHPSLTKFKRLYDNGMLRIIQGVGYPDSNKSHFKSSDLWLSGGDGTSLNFDYQSGWVGRFIENYYTDLLHENFPVGIQLGSGDNSLSFHGEVEHGLSINISNQDVSGFYSVVNGLGGIPPDAIPDSEYGQLVQFLIDLDNSTNIYAEAISSAFDGGSNTVSYPDNELANQLKTVARFISGGLQTKIYLVKLPGFDTHDGQVMANAAHEGFHASLLKKLAEAVEPFITDMNNQGKGDDVLAITFSEFGRKAAENANLGTDHGEVAPMFVFGKSVTPGISGTNINLSEATAANNFQVQTTQHDYRGVFSTVLQDWLGAKNEILDATLYDRTMDSGFANKKIPNLINSTSLVPPFCYNGIPVNPPKTVNTVMVYPNPCSDFISANAPADNPIYTISVISTAGTTINFCKNPQVSAEMTIDIRHLALGFYYLKIETKKGLFSKKIIVRR
ncbi:MAG: DUF1501 domain-containing protein [Burkholderiales bacterium]|nr:DUF1501 domain-containing protein [Flavobacterium sp.]